MVIQNPQPDTNSQTIESIRSLAEKLVSAQIKYCEQSQEQPNYEALSVSVLAVQSALDTFFSAAEAS